MERYTYVKDLNGTWLLYDNLNDPNQINNLCNNPEYSELQADMEEKLQKLLRQHGDKFLEGKEYMKNWSYTWDMDDSVKINNETTVGLQIFSPYHVLPHIWLPQWQKSPYQLIKLKRLPYDYFFNKDSNFNFVLNKNKKMN